MYWGAVRPWVMVGQVLGGRGAPPSGWRVPLTLPSLSHSMGLSNLCCLLPTTHRAGHLSLREPPLLLSFTRAFSKSFSHLGMGRRAGGGTWCPVSPPVPVVFSFSPSQLQGHLPMCYPANLALRGGCCCFSVSLEASGTQSTQDIVREKERNS